MKRFMLLIIGAMVLCMLPGCQSTTGQSSQTSAEACYNDEYIFESVDEMMAYMSTTAETAPYILTDKRQATIYVPSDIPAGFSMDMIRLSGGYVTYNYVNDNYTIADDSAIASAQRSDPNDKERPLESATEQNEIQSEMDELGRDAYIKKYGLSETDADEINKISNSIKMEWSFKAADGQKLLENTIKIFSLSESSEFPGYYSYPIIYPGTEEIIGYRVFWESENICFGANVPASIMNKAQRSNSEFPLAFTQKTANVEPAS